MSMDTIDQWFETPVFVPEPDEIWEERATSRSSVLRLAANLMLRLDARLNIEARTARFRRNRLSEALDKWAEREIETQLRLESLVLPKRWRG
jgi:hypothetical protein